MSGVKTTTSKLAELIYKSSLTQGELAKQLNVNRSTIIRWEKDIRSANGTKLVEICDIFDISLDELLGRI